MSYVNENAEGDSVNSDPVIGTGKGAKRVSDFLITQETQKDILEKIVLLEGRVRSLEDQVEALSPGGVGA